MDYKELIMDLLDGLPQEYQKLVYLFVKTLLTSKGSRS